MKKGKIVVHDELLAKVGVALRRAARRARQIAEQTNTPIVVFENGKVVKK
jgi:DNA-directed RNA polymerase subunit K/omega